MALLTVMGLYNYDNTLLDKMVYPNGMDGDQLKNNIILETAELEVIYPEPRFFKTAINLWSHSRLDTWNRIYTASQLDYNPIENYNRYETESTGNTRQHSGSDTTSATSQLSGTDSTTTSTEREGSNTATNTTKYTGTDTTSATSQHSGNDTSAETISKTTTIDGEISKTISGTDATTIGQNHVTTNEITAFDSNALQTHDKTTATASDTNNLTRSGTETETNDTSTTESGTTNTTITHGEKITDSGSTQYGKIETETISAEDANSENGTNTVQYGKKTTDSSTLEHGEKIADSGSRETHIHGNIGVTTSQQMLEAEMAIAEKINMYDYITRDFKMHFCVLVY